MKFKSARINQPKFFNRQILYGLLGVMAITFIVYTPALENEFTNHDDNKYVIDNPNIRELSADNITQFFSTYFDGHYHPLTLLSLAVDYQLGGLDPLPYHITNIILHLLSTAFVLLLIYLLTDNLIIAIVTSVLFGIHTLHVESVAWVAERKNVLYALFFLASLISYVSYVKWGKKKYYYCSLLLFVLSLLSKSMAIPLAVTLIAVDYLLNRNLQNKRVILEKLPFFALSVLFGLIARQAQQFTWGIYDDTMAFHERIVYSGYAFVQYIIKLVAPIHLSAIYPYPTKINGAIPLEYWLGLLLGILLLAAAIYFLRHSKHGIFGILFFVINICLVLKLFRIPVGDYIMADRYGYIPSIGLFFLIGIGYKKIMESKNRVKKLIPFLFAGYLLFISVLTYNRCQIWKDSVMLWSDVLSKYPNMFWAWNLRGNARLQSDNYYGAIMDFNNAVQIKPNHFYAYFNRGIVKCYMLNFREAIPDYDKVIELNPKYARGYYNRGITKFISGDIHGAIIDYDMVISLSPDYAMAYYNRGNANTKLGNLQKAIADFDEATRLKPDYAKAFFNKGSAKIESQNYSGAVADYSKVIEIEPGNIKAYYKRASAKFDLQDYFGAIEDYDKTIILSPVHYQAYSGRGTAKALTGNYDKAIDDFDKSIQLKPDHADAYFMRGMVKIGLGQQDSGCEDLDIANQLGVAEAKEKLKKHCAE